MDFVQNRSDIPAIRFGYRSRIDCSIKTTVCVIDLLIMWRRQLPDPPGAESRQATKRRPVNRAKLVGTGVVDQHGRTAARFVFTPTPAGVYGRFPAAQQSQSGPFRPGSGLAAGRPVGCGTSGGRYPGPATAVPQPRLFSALSQSEFTAVSRRHNSVNLSHSGGERGGSRPAGTLWHNCWTLSKTSHGRAAAAFVLTPTPARVYGRFPSA